MLHKATASIHDVDDFDKNPDVVTLPKHQGTVISWPKAKASGSGSEPPAPSPEAEELRKGMELLSKLETPQGQADRLPRDERFPFIPPARSSVRWMLQEEMPQAMEAYRAAVTYVRKALPKIVATRKIDVGALEKVMGKILASLERNRDALFCLAKIVALKDYINTHSTNVCIYLAAYALDCGKSWGEATAAGIAGLLHDTGMVMLPESLLRAPGKLSPTENVLVRRHPTLAHDLLRKVPGIDEDILLAALEHHERFDGTGYPSALGGRHVSQIGHATAIASSFDAISSSRSFKRSLQPHYALGEMFKKRGTQFHPDILDAFIRMVGIFPVGTIVKLEDGYLGVVSAISADNLTRPIITLVSDPAGRPMTYLECNMASENVARIASCLTADEASIPLHKILGIRR